ncbi:Gfo/Idh/MocA family oxidoreductase [Neobacillus pocheonensis]|uniref:Gfo/Idh/MocA family oxidoreductase n=1 Tax=Neobacillus pocheonensis TaxID=363869 RepID=A0ABT0WFM3_9BACI|nr:Gfo/Idh/MocA family oxidoreductase [Neobacillus pocheonensis]
MKKSSKIRVGIIGLGVIGEKILCAFQKHPKFEIVSICDVVKERAELISQKLNGIVYYTDYKELLQNSDVELVYVAVPPKYHHLVALDVLAAGKHILCEKPLANSLEEARAMSEHAKQAGVVHAMHFPVYYTKAFKYINNFVTSEKIGEIRRVEINTHFHKWPCEWQQTDWIGGREQGGFVREVFPHYIQLTQALFGKLEHIQSQLELPADSDKCETGILASMKLSDGTPLLINGVSQIAQQERIAFTIYGTNGTISLVNWIKLEVGKYDEPLTEISLQPVDPTLDLLMNLANAIKGDRADIIDFQAGYEIQKVLEALLQKI